MLSHPPTLGLLVLALVASLLLPLGCSPSARPTDTVAEGVIYYVEYRLEDGRTGGFTRLNSSQAVPGGNGSWNVDAYGRLTREFLIITRPQQRGLGPRVIPVHRLVDLQFGDGGINKVQENKPAPPN